MEVGPTQCNPGFLLKTGLPATEISQLAKKFRVKKENLSNESMYLRSRLQIVI